MLIRLPATMRQQGKSGTLELEVPASGTLRTVIDEIEKQIPGASARIVTTDGRMHGYVNLYVNGDDVRHGAGLDTPVSNNDEVLILPSISGG